jgi:hypothetical protein
MGEFWGQMVKDGQHPFAVIKDPKYYDPAVYLN